MSEGIYYPGDYPESNKRYIELDLTDELKELIMEKAIENDLSFNDQLELILYKIFKSEKGLINE